MVSVATGAELYKILSTPALLAYVPVAAHLNLFNVVAESDKPVSGQDVLTAYKNGLPDGGDSVVPGLPLIRDTLLAMAGLGFVNGLEEDLYTANDLTHHLAASPGSIHGAIHHTTEMLLAAPFLVRKLKAENFAYPFRDRETPFQFAYKMMGNEDYAKKDLYAIMAAEGRMDSFNTFMGEKFTKAQKAHDRLRTLGYDLNAALKDGPSTAIKMVDIGGGRGHLLLELKDAFPQLQTEDLIVEEFNDDLGDISEVKFVRWNYKDQSTPQPIKGALIYHLSHVLHNLPDLEATRLLQRIREAMAPHSRLLVHELTRNVQSAGMHAFMMLVFGGRERVSSEWHQMAALAGLQVTFEAYPDFGPGLIEFRTT
ncbi:S-adenosyl-L-methionine-dependent methyltransferase [Aspergillus lucknowensis]|uniref:S-adenosyl-L-methionine-dependent methyltransferase n=1 Tax=Aspergillus lucknowensis TaxID=176173 RepID=A0ABR4L5P5_9EURO